MDKKLLAILQGQGGGGSSVDIVTQLSQESTDQQVPSAKCVYDALRDTSSVILNTNNALLGTVSGGGMYKNGTQVTIHANVIEGNTFAMWKDSNGNTLSTDADYTFTVSNDIAINALFIEGTDLEIVPYSTGDIDKIKKMVSLADDGIIELSDYWSADDVRLVHFTAIPEYKVDDGAGNMVTIVPAMAEQDVRFRLADKTCTGYTLDTIKGKPNFIVEALDLFTSNGTTGGLGCKWNFKNDTYGDRNTMPLQLWLDGMDYLLGHMEEGFRSLLKQMNYKMWALSPDGNNRLVDEQHYLSLPPRKCVINTGSSASAQEDNLFNTWEVYTDSASRIKHNGQYGGAAIWWLGSVSNGTYFFRVLGDGDVTTGNASNALGVAPFGCI